jgi:hypothetical protein
MQLPHSPFAWLAAEIWTVGSTKPKHSGPESPRRFALNLELHR